MNRFPPQILYFAITAIGLSLSIAGLFLQRAEVSWATGCMMAGVILTVIGVRLVFSWFVSRYGQLHVPSWLGFVILFALVGIVPAIFGVLAIVKWLGFR